MMVEKMEISHASQLWSFLSYIITTVIVLVIRKKFCIKKLFCMKTNCTKILTLTHFIPLGGSDGLEIDCTEIAFIHTFYLEKSDNFLSERNFILLL